MEVHLVYYDSEYESLVKAMDDPKGLCVFSIIGKVIDMNIFNILGIGCIYYGGKMCES